MIHKRTGRDSTHTEYDRHNYTETKQGGDVSPEHKARNLPVSISKKPETTVCSVLERELAECEASISPSASVNIAPRPLRMVVLKGTQRRRHCAL